MSMIVHLMYDYMYMYIYNVCCRTSMLCRMLCLMCNVHVCVQCFSFSCRRTTYLLAAFLVRALHMYIHVYAALALCVCCIPVIIMLPSLDRFLGVSRERAEQSSSSSSLSCEFHTTFIGDSYLHVHVRVCTQ